MTQILNIAIAGIAGRMGMQLAQAALAAGHKVTGGTEAPGSDYQGQPINNIVSGLDPALLVSDKVQSAAADADIWIDFTVPGATLSALSALADTKVKAVIIGTTGFSDEQEAHIEQAANSLSIVKAGNFSLGINLLQALVRQAAARLDEGWDIEILETHHRRKLDAPSGTALMLGEAAAAGRGKPLKDLRAAPYDGTNAKRVAGEIGFSVRRTGDVIGEHEVTFGSDLEQISLSHVANDRSVFAHGAIKAGEWAVRQPSGLYSIEDVLGV